MRSNQISILMWIKYHETLGIDCDDIGEYGELKVGDTLPSGAEILGVFQHNPSDCIWFVVRKPDDTIWEVYLDEEDTSV